MRALSFELLAAAEPPAPRRPSHSAWPHTRRHLLDFLEEARLDAYTPVFVAQTESSRQVNIVARVSGFLDRIAYQEGELVK